ncbi:glycosyl hydrolase BNR repeat-containing protein [Pseudomonas sp. St29]|nr:glycosyl hydrolase BNR repeat-containing protein [Pseudomonas sp. St29]
MRVKSWTAPGERVETTLAQEEVWVGSENAQESEQWPCTDNMLWLSVLWGRGEEVRRSTVRREPSTQVQGEASFAA